MVLSPPFTAVDDPIWTPRGPSVPLTLSGNEITPYVRRFGREGDGLNANELLGKYSLGVWEATTNLVTNGGFQTNANGWALNASGDDTPTRSTAQAKFGSASLLIGGTGVVVSQGASWAATGVGTAAQGQVWTASAWIYSPNAITVAAFIAERATDGSALTEGGGTGVVLTPNTWTRLTYTRTLTEATVDRLRLKVLCTAQFGSQWTAYVDGAQLELQPLATPYVHTDGGTASRSAARVRIPNALRYVSASQGWAALGFRQEWADANEPLGGSGFVRLFTLAEDANNYLIGYRREASNDFRAEHKDGTTAQIAAASTIALAVGDIVVYIIKWSGTSVGVSNNGVAFVNNTSVTGPPTISAATAIDIFSTGSSSHYDGTLLFAALGRGTLTDANAAALNNIARNNRIDSRPEDLPGGCTFKWPPADGDVTRALVVA